jgi:F1F0 ATPase subunit 2
MFDPQVSPWLLALVFAGGAVLGAGFFGGLWWTVRRGFASSQPGLWFLLSLILRTGIALCGFFLLGGTDWRRWLAALAGFAVARFAVERVTREGVSHAPQP